MIRYRGDTFGKKFARLRFWLSVKETDPAKFETNSYIYLASRDGGDASVLSGLGIPPHQQLAVDIDRQAIEEFKRKWPSIPTAFGDIADVIEARRAKADVIYLDFCGYLTDRMVRTAARVVKAGLIPNRPNAVRTGLVGLTYKRGREPHADDLKQLAGARSMTGIRALKPQGNNDKNKDGRFDWLAKQLGARLAIDRMMLLPFLGLTYQSKTLDSPGSPMATAGFRVVQIDKRVSYNQAKRRQLFAAVNMHKKPGVLGAAQDFSSDDYGARQIAYCANWMEANRGMSHAQVASAFNVDPKTLSAWKAHFARGTYNLEA